MPTSIDENGDTGRLGHGSGSLPYFRLAAVWLPCQAAVEGFRESIRGARTRLRLKASHEFKYAWTHSEPEQRAAFFGAAIESGFKFAACAIDKTDRRWRTASAQEMHWACAVSVASCLRTTYQNAEASLPPKNGKPCFLRELVIVDDNEDDGYLKTLENCLQGLPSSLNPKVSLVGKVKFRGSGSDEMIQLADMVVGAVGGYVSAGGDATWYRMIRDRCVGLVKLP